MAASAISSGVIGRWGDIVGVWIAPVTAHVMMTLRGALRVLGSVMAEGIVRRVDYVIIRGMDLEIEGLRVMVSAGAAGIGLEIARAFAREGAKVHVCDLDRDALARLASTDPALGATACDVSDRAQVARFFDEALARLGGLDCLVNNAGIAGPTGPIEGIDPVEWDRCIAIDLTGQFNCARLAVPHLRSSTNASILNVSSLAGRMGFALRTPYASAKWGVIGLAKSLAIELGPDRIRVNALLPGVVAGERQRRVLTAKAEARGVPFEAMEEIALSHTSLREYVTPQQLADLAVFVASPRGRTISGQALSVCGDTNMLA
jgi:NAD(P)-dependent dehydrogenase (short-subunit alcohol dehydrogenase family)